MITGLLPAPINPIMENDTKNKPQSAAAPNGVSVQVGDVFYYRTYSPEQLGQTPWDKGEPLNVTKHEIVDVTANQVKYDIYTAPEKVSGDKEDEFDWSWKYQRTEIETYDTASMINHTYCNSSVVDIQIANNTGLIENISAVFQDLISAENDGIIINVDLETTTEGFHRIKAEGYFNGTANWENYVSGDIWINATTGFAVYQEMNMSGEATVEELMGYDLNGDRIPWDAKNDDVFGYEIGDVIHMFRPEMEGHDEEDPEYMPGPQFMEFKVIYIYFVPKYNQSVILLNTSEYFDSQFTDKAHEMPYMQGGRVVKDNATSQIGQIFHQKDISVSDETGFESDLATMFEQGMDLDVGSVNADWRGTTQEIVVTGTNNSGSDTFKFYQQMHIGYGHHRFMKEEYYSSSEDQKFIHMEMMIDGPGVDESHSGISVSEGDSWEVIEQHEIWGRWWDSSNEDSWEDRGVIYEKFTVTHIFPLNASNVAVCGKIEFWTSQDSTHVVKKGFEPFLIYDTNNPASFINMGGLMEELEGPPTLLPTTLDVTQPSTQDAIINNLPDHMFDESTIKTKYGTNLMRIKGKPDSPEAHGENGLWIEWDTNGITSHLEMQVYEFKEEGSTGEERDEEIFMILYSTSLGCNSGNPSDVTSIDTGDELIWEQQEYNPNDEQLGDSVRRSREKYIIGDVLGTCDGSVVSVGAKYHRLLNASEYKSAAWELNEDWGSTHSGTPINFWALGLLKDDNMWTWLSEATDGRVFDKGITDFASYTGTIAQMLNFGFLIPDSQAVTSSDIQTNGTIFEVSIDMPEDGETITRIMRFAVNEEGILQDMFQGGKYTNGTWKEWERTVLVNGTGSEGEVFTDDIPDNYTPVDTGEDTTPNDSPLGISGYPTIFSMLFAFAGIVLILQRKKH